MNADTTDTRSPHLDLGDLIAEANGQPIGDEAREHLAGCEQCRLEASRWNLVADGVRGLAAAAPEAPRTTVPAMPATPAVPAVPAVPTLAAHASHSSHPSDPAQPQRAGRRVLAGHGRRALLVAGSAAAAFVLLVGVGAAAGLVHVHLSGGPSTEPILTAVSGCPVLEQAGGTLEQVNGSSLVIKASSGQALTVTTTAATRTSEGGALLGDITDGAFATVWGSSSGKAIAAFSVILGHPAQGHLEPPAGAVVVTGTVADASTAGFTVVTADGTRVPVTTSGQTAVGVLNARLSQLPVGATILAVGDAGPDGTLSAQGVAAIVQLSQGGRQVHAQVHISVKSCSRSSVDHAILLAAGG